MSKKCKRRANEGGIYEDHKAGCEAATRIRGDRPCDLAPAETPPPTYKRLKSCGSCYDIVGAVGTTEGRLLGEVRKHDCTDVIHAKVTPLLDAAQRAADIEHRKLVRDTLKATLRTHIDADARAVGERERAKNLAAEAARFKAAEPVKVAHGPDFVDTFTNPRMIGGKPKPGGWDPFTTPATNAYEPPPSHYATPGGIDPWAVWDAFDLDRYVANAVKYLLRAGKKDIAPRLDDLKKARNYINKAIEREEKK